MNALPPAIPSRWSMEEERTKEEANAHVKHPEGQEEPLEMERFALQAGMAELQIALEKATTQQERAQLRKDLAKAKAHYAETLKLIEESRPPYEILTEQDLEELGEDETPEVIEGLLKEGGSLMIVSPGGLIKSWLGQHIAQCQASGSDFLGRYAVREGNSLIVDAENLPKEIRARLRMIRKSLGIEITNRVCLLSKPEFLLDNEKNVDDLIGLLRGVERMTIIIDPLIRFHTGNENSAQDMSRVTRALNRMQRELGATIILMQHQTKPGFMAPKGIHAVRGSSELYAWPDMVLMCDRKDGEYRGTVAKNRYGRDGQTIVWDTYIDEEEGRADFTFLREESAEITRDERVRGWISDLFETDKEWTIQEIHQALQAHRVGINLIRGMVKRLELDGEIEHRGGAHRKGFYRKKGSSVTAGFTPELLS